MNISEIIERLSIIQTRLKSHLPNTMRLFFQSTRIEDRGVMLIGARGVGKTTFMLKCLDQGHLFYFSADNPLVSTVPLYDLIENLFMQGYEGMFVDEVHYASGWSQSMKAAYDFLIDNIKVEVGGKKNGSRTLIMLFEIIWMFHPETLSLCGCLG